MSRFHSYINTSANLIGLFKGDQPFAVFSKNFFSQNKKYGSRDRKQIANLCYNYFRIGFAMKESTIIQKIIVGIFLCENHSSGLLAVINPEWNKKISWPLDKKLLVVKDQFLLTDIFPFKQLLSKTIDAETYWLSMLQQPFLFLRIRPQCRLTALKKLEKSMLSYQVINNNSIQLPTGINAEDFFILDKEVVVQDYNSQQVLNYLHINEVALFGKEDIKQPGLLSWDCCAASGGKSILLQDILKRKINLTISDNRLRIVVNLHKRFKVAKIKEYKYYIVDITDKAFTPPSSNYKLIICDAPCTGSGTWGRTPEQLNFFNTKAVKDFSEKQKKIVSNVLLHLMHGGIFVYITCSVFREENEAIAEFINDNFKVELLHQEILKGYDKRADTMFVAIFKKKLV